MPELNNSAFIQIDGAGIVVINKEDNTLVMELLRHFTPRWQAKAASEGMTDVMLLIQKMLAHLDIEHTVLPQPTNVSVLTTCDSAPQEPDSSSNQDTAFPEEHQPDYPPDFDPEQEDERPFDESQY